MTEEKKLNELPAPGRIWQMRDECSRLSARVRDLEEWTSKLVGAIGPLDPHMSPVGQISQMRDECSRLSARETELEDRVEKLEAGMRTAITALERRASKCMDESKVDELREIIEGR